MSAPNPREIQEFQFKLLHRIRIFHSDAALPSGDFLSLVAVASKYGLVFVSCPSGLNVIQSQKVVDLYAHEKKKPPETYDFPSRIISLPTPPSHLEVSCDNQYLAVYYVAKEVPSIEIYLVSSFLSKEETIAVEIRPGECVSLMSWNPGVNTMLAACLIDGSAAVFELKNSVLNINSIPAEAQATCLCWSPKGKQIVIGSANGSLSQFKPELKIVKSIPPPPSQNPLSVVSVQWLSNFQFAAVYKDNSNHERPALYIVNTPKVGDVSYINYDDICFSTSTWKPPQYYIIHQQNWNVLLVASATSMELGVLGLQNDTWEQWIQEDQSRAELPLSAEEKGETFPVGMALDTSVQYNLPLGENQILPPMPLLILLSDEGLLSLFFVINLLPSAANICSPPELLPDQSGLHHFKLPGTYPRVSWEEEIPPSPLQQEVLKPVATTESWMSTPTSIQAAQTVIQVQHQAQAAAQAHAVAQAQAHALALAQSVSQPQHNWLGINQPQTSSVPKWVSAANPTLSLTTASSQLSSTKGFPAATSIPASSAPPTSLFGMGSKSTQSFTLPGTQITITPVATSVGSISQPSTSADTPLTPTYSFPSSSPQVLTTSKPIANIMPVEVKRTEPVAPQLIDISPVKSGEEAKDAASAKNDAVIMAAINEEVAIFNAELEEHKLRSKINIHIGLEEEKEFIEQQVQSLEAFFKDLKETTAAQRAEVHSLKNGLLETFNWIEDVKSREEQHRNPYFMKLVKSRDLDPVTARKMESINHLLYYIDSQINQVNKILDNMWCDFPNKGPKTTMKVPSLETVYQALVYLNNIINQQRLIVDDIERKLEARRRMKSNIVPFISDESLVTKESESNELSKLAENFLKVKLANSSMNSPKEIEEEYSIIDAAQPVLSERKTALLQKALLERPITRITPSRHINRSRKMANSSSILSMISSLPASGAKPGGISSGRPIVTSSTPRESNVVQEQIKANDKPFKTLDSVIPKKDETNQANTQVLGEVKNNLTPSSYSETPVKPTPVTGQKLVHTNLFGNKENKPSSASVAMTSSMLVTQPQIPFGQSQSKVFSFSSSKEISYGASHKVEHIPQTEITKPNSSITSSSPFTLKISNNSQATSPTSDSSVQAKSPLSSLTNMVTGFVDIDTLPRISPEKSTIIVPKISTNQPFQFSIPVSDPNKTIQNSVTTVSMTQSSNMSPTDSVAGKNLFGGSTSSQKTSLISESTVQKPIFSEDSTPTKSMFGGNTKTKNMFGGDSTTKSSFGGGSTTTKNIFGADSSSSKIIFGLDSTVGKALSSVGDFTPVKNIFSSDTSTVTKNTSESDSTKSKVAFGKDIGTAKSSFGNDSTTSTVFVKDVSLPQSISDSDLNAIKSSSNVDINVSKSATDLSSYSSKLSVDVSKVTTTNVNQNVSSGIKSSPVHSTSGPSKTVFSSGNSNTTKSVFGVEPIIIQTESLAPTEIENVSSTVTVTTEDSSQVESSSDLFGGLNLGSPTTTQTKPGANMFGEGSNKFGSSNVDTVSTEITSAQKQTEESPNVFGNATTVASSFNFAAAGASLFTGQSKSESTSTVTSSPTKTDTTALNFGQLTVSATETPPASNTIQVMTKAAAFSFSLPQSTTPTATSTFSFAQAASSISSTVSDDKNTKINLTFGQPSVTTASSIFGGFNTQPATTSTSTSIFGSPPASTTPQTSFSFAIASTTPPQTSFFGNKPSIFGTPPATTTNSFFGQSSPATTTSVFGQPSVTTPVFGQAAASPTSSPFGSSSGFGAKPTFGQSGGSLFGQSPSGGFGSSGGTSIFGGGNSVFGSSGSGSGGSLFQPSGTGSIFGGGSTNPGGSFSSGGQSVSQSGFGSPPAFQNKLGAFGAAPAFGASSPPTFGSTPTFGGAPAFGSPPKVFGSSPTGGFGSPTQQSTAFESLANQNTMSFGNLAQNQAGGFGSAPVFGGTPQTPPQQQPGFSNTGSSFSGTSFSSWR